MNWITYSLLMFIGSVGAYLSIRFTKEYKIPNPIVNLANFLIPALVFFIILITTGKSFYVDPLLMIWIVIFAIVGNYVGSNIGLNAMNLSSNPGLSLIIQKSYAVFTAIAAYFLFGSELTIKNFIAILVIIVFVMIMSYEKKFDTSQKEISFWKKYWWVVLSIIAGLIWGSNALFAKYMIINGVDIYVRLFYITFFTALTAIFEVIRNKSKVSFNKKNILSLLGVGIFFTFFYLFLQKAYEVTPNIGYVNVINTSSITVLTLLSTITFKDKITWQKVIGIIGVSVGVIIILI